MLVVQSAPAAVPPWVSRCLASVAAWAASAGFAYERLGDELFEFVPAGLSAGPLSARPSLPRLAATDLARLALLRARLDEGHDAVLWLDADVLVFAPEHLRLPADELAACREVWITGDGSGGGGGLRALDYVCNAAVLARAPGASLDALSHATSARACDPKPVQDRSLGPDLLTVLHRRSPFALLGGVGLCSPLVVRDLAAGGGPALDLLRASSPEPLGAVNLCASTSLPEAVFEGALDALTSGGHGLD